MQCEDCGIDDGSVKRFKLFGEHEPGGTQHLCFDCRWPWLRTRIHGPEADGPPGDVVVPDDDEEESEFEQEPTTGQAGLSDFI